MLIFTRELVHLGDFGFGNISSKDSTYCFSLGMNGQHNLGRLFPVHAEEQFQHFNYKLHGCVVIVVHNDLVHGGTLETGFLYLGRNMTVVFVIVLI